MYLISAKRNTFVANILFLLLLNLFLLNLPPGLQSLDTRFWYPTSAVRALFDLLGPEGRHQYVTFACIDIFVYIPTYTLLIIQAFQLRFAKRKKPVPRVA